MEVSAVIGAEALFGSASTCCTINSKGAQAVGLALAAFMVAVVGLEPAQPRSLGTMNWNLRLGSLNALAVGLLKFVSVPLILMLYQVACTSSPRKNVCGANSRPRA